MISGEDRYQSRYTTPLKTACLAPLSLPFSITLGHRCHTEVEGMEWHWAGRGLSMLSPTEVSVALGDSIASP